MHRLNIQELVCKYYSFLRSHHEVKIEMLAIDTDIPSSYISQWENNKKQLSIERQQILFEYFGKNYCDVKNRFEEYNNLFSRYLDHYFSRKNHNYIQIVDKCKDEEDILYPYYLIIRMLYEDEDKYNKLYVDFVSKRAEFLNDEFKQIFNMLLGDYWVHNHNFKKATEFYDMAINSTDNKYILSMIYFQRAIMYLRANQIYECESDVMIAHNYFKETFCNKRAIACHTTLGIIYGHSNRIVQANNEFIEAYSMCEFFSENDYLIEVKKQQCLYYIRIEEYKLACDIALELFNDYRLKTDEIYFYIVVSCYKLGKYNDVVRVNKHYLDNYRFAKSHLYYRLMSIIVGIVNEEYLEIQRRVRNSKKLISTKADFTLKLIMYTILKDYYKSIGKYKNMSQYAELIINLYQHIK